MTMTRIKMIRVKLLATAFLLAWEALPLEVLKKDAALGKWTMDFDAAIELAKKQNLSVFLNFTGSDWCGWCKLMERNVFNQEKWNTFAIGNLALVTIDFPQDPAIVPSEFKERNLRLQQQFGVMGYPTYVLLDSDGERELGRLGASQDKNAISFAEEVKNIIKYSNSYVENYSKALSSEEAAQYKRLIDKLNALRSEFGNWLQSQPEESEENFTQFMNYLSELNAVTIKIDTIEAKEFAKNLSSEQAKEYLALTTKLNDIRNEMDQWLKSRPEATDANRDKKDRLESEIKKIKRQISQF